METPTIGIIIINWNSFELTHDCLKSLENVHYRAISVILVDNDSSDNSLELLKTAHPWIVTVENTRNLGFTGGNNSGIRKALELGCDYVMLLNNDTKVEPDFLNILLAKIESDSSIGAVQPKIYYESDRNVIWNAGGKYNPLFTRPTPIGENKIDDGSYETTKPTDWITGCAFLIRSSVVKEVGLTSELYFYGCFDDVDYSMEIRKKGYQLYFCADSKVYHAVGMASKSEKENPEGVLKPFFHYLATRNNWFFIRRHVKSIYIIPTLIYQIYSFLGHIAYFTFKRRFRKLRAYLHGFFHGFTKPLDESKLNHISYIQLYK
ncbi:hypothetical protein BFP97_13560 [Roseivirga sp. 4D4]|uniref:glycosyltransferase family 2 protein n=1 Tax=Roseivirga sp. 4D4 TaxID=1889784 RepID=UPI0008531D89|nr:glycosyltransferase family 2 protein [Roseivirga sp. 4D4]OEK02484.1 hypothetical protein BFP97_13560 [Roseivirga sp. 4D4]